MSGWCSKILKENRSLLCFIVLMSLFRSSFADWNTVPTGSMKPTILEGDRILVNKMAYDIRLPFTHVSLYETADPVRGDIIIFDSEASGLRLVKRVIGTPGDTVELQDNVLRVNGMQSSYQALAATPATEDRLESLPGMAHSVRVSKAGSPLSSFAPVTVPADHYLALGDNRDDSSDSRVIGLVPRREIVGRTGNVVMSFDYENYYMPRADRFFHGLADSRN